MQHYNFDLTQARTWDLSHPKGTYYHSTTLAYRTRWAVCKKNRKIAPLPVVELHSISDFWNPRKMLHKKQSCLRCRFLSSSIFDIDIRLAAEFAQDLRLAAEFAPAPNLVVLCKMTISFQNQRKICDFFYWRFLRIRWFELFEKKIFTRPVLHTRWCAFQWARMSSLLNIHGRGCQKWARMGENVPRWYIFQRECPRW